MRWLKQWWSRNAPEVMTAIMIGLFMASAFILLWFVYESVIAR